MRCHPPSTLQTIEITLSGDDTSAKASRAKAPSAVHTYTTYDDIRGHVAISALAPTPFSRVEICLLGITRTIQTDHPGPIIDVPRVANIFLRMDFPLSPSTYPSGSNDTYLLNPGSPIHIPFHFVVPARLLPHACRHERFSSSVSEAHTQLPPSLGSFSMPRDDLAFDMANISYSIYARLIAPSPTNKTPKTLSFAQRKFHIVPAGEEAPPLLVLEESKYVLSKSKTMRKGMFRGKLGTLTLTTSQPRAFSLPPPRTCGPHTSSALTDITLTVRFDPADPSCAPPRLGALSAWISATTVHSISPASRIPNQELKGTSYDNYSRELKTNVALAEDVPAADAQLWRAVRAPKSARRDSGYSSAGSLSPAYSPSSSPAPSTASTDLVSASDEEDEVDEKISHYTLTIALPFALAPSRTWIPTFHSCYVSRFYTLLLTLMVHPPGAAMPFMLSLEVPVQVIGKGRKGREEAFVARGRAGSVGVGKGGELGVLEGVWDGYATENADGGWGRQEMGPGDELLPGYMTPDFAWRRRRGR